MKTHTTIQLAFANGKGDCFLTKNNEFVAISRKNFDLQEKLINDGYTLLSYTEVTELAKLTEGPKKSEIIETKTPEPIKSTIKKPYNNNYNGLAYLDEFSDADPGL